VVLPCLIGSFRYDAALSAFACSCYHGRMPKRPRRPRDPNELAFQVFQEAIGEALPPPEREKNAAAVALGKLGGAKGGKARAANMTPEERRESAMKAAKARWERQKK
jgi:hypothetical protein